MPVIGGRDQDGVYVAAGVELPEVPERGDLFSPFLGRCNALLQHLGIDVAQGRDTDLFAVFGGFERVADERIATPVEADHSGPDGVVRADHSVVGRGT